MTALPEVVILGGRAEGWHGRELRRALAGRGLAIERIDFAQCRFAIADHGTGIRLGDRAHLPRAVLVRSIPAGTFEQVTLRLGMLHALEALGVAVVNSARSIERCVDKAATSFALAQAGLPTPSTSVVETSADAEALAQEAQALGRKLVLKPLFGAQGRGLRLITGPGELPDAAEVGGVYYLQRFVDRADGQWRDYRVFVVGGTAVAAMSRRGTTWITNIGQGGVPHPEPATGPLAELAVAAATAVGAAHAGVDLIEDEQGRLVVLEVNSMPAWQGLQSVTETDVAAALATFLADRVGRSAA